MRAAVYKGPDRPWAVEVVSDPTPGCGEMILKVERCAICGSDVHMTSGRGLTMPNDCILGHEYGGESLRWEAASRTDVPPFFLRFE